MILVGNQRGNSKDMADHLLKAENEEIVVYEISGFMGNDLHTAFQESYAASLATNATQHLYSLSLNPPKYADVSDEYFIESINRAEERLGLTGQPRAIVFHYKRDGDGNLRKHAHVVWSRITDDLKAVHMSHDRKRLKNLARELFLENGWELPSGFESGATSDPLSYTHAEHQQARRRHKYANDIKRLFQIAWAQSDTKEAFASALLEKGYVLARGDRGRFVAVDAYGEVYSLPRTLNLKTSEIRDRFGDYDDLPSVEEATEIAENLENSPTLLEPTRDKSPLEKRLIQDPEYALELITEHESTFSKADIAKLLNTHIYDSDEFRTALDTVVASDNIVALNEGAGTPEKDIRYSTSEMVQLEQKLMRDSMSMAGNTKFEMSRRAVENAIDDQNADMRSEFGISLSREQEEAIRHITGEEQLTCVVGVAGAGKSTILNAARQAWEASGYRVLGAALAGKAAKGLEQSSGISSRTLASLELSWQNEANQLQKGDILVIDEAGMIGSRQMSRFINEAKQRDAKIVLVGDAEQLQPIEAGAPFRAITERIDAATLHEVYRQKQNWMKQASKQFALGDTEEALAAYQDQGAIEFSECREDAIEALVSDYLNDFWSSEANPSQLALAHRKADVKAVNQTIRKARIEAGELQDGTSFKTTHGNRKFAAGDRILFTRNDRDIGVQNGMLGTVIDISDGKLSIELDDKADNGRSTRLSINADSYSDFDHGYATTIHKSQGATVDKSYVLASNTLDRHLTYVAMTRHHHETKLYADKKEFPNRNKFMWSLGRKKQKQSSLDFIPKNENQKSRSERFLKRARTAHNFWADQSPNIDDDHSREFTM